MMRQVLPSTLISLFFSLAVFILSLLSTSICLETKAPTPEVPVVSQKLRYLEEHGDEYNVFFLGSSHVYHQIIPQLFDRLMAQAGIDTHSFNLGANGMRPPENEYVLENSLKSRRTPLRWVIEEADPIRFSIDKNISDSVRGIYWRDATRMGWLLRRTLTGRHREKRSVLQRAGEFLHESGDFWGHCWYYLPNVTHLGALYPELQKSCGVAAPGKSESFDPQLDGFSSPGDVTMSLRMSADYEKDLAQRRHAPVAIDYGDPTSQELLSWTQKLVSRKGGQLILFVPPTSNDSKFYPDPKIVSDLPVIDFSDSARDPELFADENRKDTSHLNEAGAEILTRLIVKRILEQIPAAAASPRR